MDARFVTRLIDISNSEDYEKVRKLREGLTKAYRGAPSIEVLSEGDAEGHVYLMEVAGGEPVASARMDRMASGFEICRLCSAEKARGLGVAVQLSNELLCMYEKLLEPGQFILGNSRIELLGFYHKNFKLEVFGEEYLKWGHRTVNFKVFRSVKK